MKIILPYGEEGLDINLPDSLNIDILEPGHTVNLPDHAAEIPVEGVLSSTYELKNTLKWSMGSLKVSFLSCSSSPCQKYVVTTIDGFSFGH